jgi:hypothetical protein
LDVWLDNFPGVARAAAASVLKARDGSNRRRSGASDYHGRGTVSDDPRFVAYYAADVILRETSPR